MGIKEEGICEIRERIEHYKNEVENLVGRFKKIKREGLQREERQKRGYIVADHETMMQAVGQECQRMADEYCRLCERLNKARVKPLIPDMESITKFDEEETKLEEAFQILNSLKKCKDEFEEEMKKR